jgi:hypothetical protein
VANDPDEASSVLLQVDVFVVADSTEAKMIAGAKPCRVNDISVGGAIGLDEHGDVFWINENITRLR